LNANDFEEIQKSLAKAGLLENVEERVAALSKWWNDHIKVLTVDKGVSAYAMSHAVKTGTTEGLVEHLARSAAIEVGTELVRKDLLVNERIGNIREEIFRKTVFVIGTKEQK